MRLESTIYIAGPMTGLPEYNYPAFNAATARLIALGWTVENPADNPPPPDDYPGLPWSWYMRRALVQVARSGAMALLPGWEDSRGARTEVFVASQLGMRIFEYVEDEGLVPLGGDGRIVLVSEVADAAAHQ